MAKSKGRYLADIIGASGLVQVTKSDLAGSDGVLELTVLPSVPNSKLTNSSVTIGGTAIALGASSSTLGAISLTGALTTNSTVDGVDIATRDALLTSTISDVALKATLASPSLTGVPVAPTAAGNTTTTQLATTAFVQQEITTLIGGAPSTLNDLNELAAAINDDANYNSTLTTALALKATIANPTFTGLVTSPNFTDGYISWNAAQFNRYGAAIELQFTPTNTATLVKIGANGSNPTIFNAYSGTASIGTASLSSTYGTLTVAGTGISTTPDTSGKIQIGRYNSSNPYSYLKASSTSSGIKFTNAADTADMMILYNNGDAKVSGLLGVNKAVNSVVALSVGSDASSTSSYGLEVCNSTSNTRFLVDGVGNSKFYKSDNALSMSVTSDGKVCIGTITPTSALHIYNSATSGNTQLHIHNDKAGDAAVLKLEGKRTSLNDTGQLLFANSGYIVAKIDARSAADDGALRFFTSPTGSGQTITERMSISTSGTVTVNNDLTVSGNTSLGTGGAQYFRGATDGNWRLGSDIVVDTGGLITGASLQMIVGGSGNSYGFQISGHQDTTHPVFEVIPGTSQASSITNIRGHFYVNNVEHGRCIVHEHNLSNSNRSISGSTTAWTATGLTKTITPQSANSYFYVEMYHNEHINMGTPNYGGGARVMGGSTEIARGGQMKYQVGGTPPTVYSYSGDAKTFGSFYAPGTASAITFTAQVAASSPQAGNYYYWHWASGYIAAGFGPRIRIYEFT